MKTTHITKKIAAIFAAAMMVATASVCASAEDKQVRIPDDESVSVISETAEPDMNFGIPRGGKIQVRVKTEIRVR